VRVWPGVHLLFRRDPAFLMLNLKSLPDAFATGAESLEVSGCSALRIRV
jgi:hypothetical protein